MIRPSRPLYFRVLGLRYIAPGRWASLVLFEGSILAGVLLALAEVVTSWAVLVLPLTVAVMVKFNDLVAGELRRRPPARLAAAARPLPARPLPARAVGRARVPAPGDAPPPTQPLRGQHSIPPQRPPGRAAGRRPAHRA